MEERLSGARFGPAGRADSFGAMGYKKTEEIPAYLSAFGLTAFEYQCGHGVRVNEASVRVLGERAKASGIALSLHSPYYISLSSLEEEKREKSVSYLLEAGRAADWMGADRVVVHTGSCGKQSREAALALSLDTLRRALAAFDENGLSHISLCPETMGKFNQLGDLAEVLSLCKAEERLIPCIDFGHLNARTLGSIRGKEDYASILDEMENALGKDRLKGFHAHFSKIEYTPNGGEKRHLTFADTLYGPEFEPLMELVAKKGLSPRFICESAGTQTEDAAAMQAAWRQFVLEKTALA